MDFTVLHVVIIFFFEESPEGRGSPPESYSLNLSAKSTDTKHAKTHRVYTRRMRGRLPRNYDTMNLTSEGKKDTQEYTTKGEKKRCYGYSKSATSKVKFQILKLSRWAPASRLELAGLHFTVTMVTTTNYLLNIESTSFRRLMTNWHILRWRPSPWCQPPSPPCHIIPSPNPVCHWGKSELQKGMR